MRLRQCIKQYLRRRGIVLLRAGYPLIRSLDRIPSLASQFEIGGPETYYLPPAYTARAQESYYNDTPNVDEYEREVYQVARMYADRDGLRSVCDVGCGSAYKLVTYFNGYQTIGVDVPETVRWLKQKYPARTWLAEDLRQPSSVRADMVMAADVIEHLMDPNQLLEHIKSIQPRLIVISTPDRNLLLNGRHLGPPGNVRHIREWGFSDFHRYISDHFLIVEHFHANPFQATQMIVARPR